MGQPTIRRQICQINLPISILSLPVSHWLTFELRKGMCHCSQPFYRAAIYSSALANSNDKILMPEIQSGLIQFDPDLVKNQ